MHWVSLKFQFIYFTKCIEN